MLVIQKSLVCMSGDNIPTGVHKNTNTSISKQGYYPDKKCFVNLLLPASSRQMASNMSWKNDKRITTSGGLEGLALISKVWQQQHHICHPPASMTPLA